VVILPYLPCFSLRAWEAVSAAAESESAETLGIGSRLWLRTAVSCGAGAPGETPFGWQLVTVKLCPTGPRFHDGQVKHRSRCTSWALVNVEVCQWPGDATLVCEDMNSATDSVYGIVKRTVQSFFFWPGWLCHAYCCDTQMAPWILYFHR
jgi:hypothetical protein